jgi:hypothetical protein
MAENHISCVIVVARQFVRSSFAFLCCAAVLLCGCGMRKKPAVLWSTAVLVRPVVPPRSSPAIDPAVDPDPELHLELPPASSGLVMAPTVPPRPRGVAPLSARNDPDRPTAPVIAPQLTPEETASAEQETNAGLSIAEKNLAFTRGKSLTAAQSDLASKIKEFITEAREAARSDDWTQARSLANKAKVLSEELVALR